MRVSYIKFIVIICYLCPINCCLFEKNCVCLRLALQTVAWLNFTTQTFSFHSVKSRWFKTRLTLWIERGWLVRQACNSGKSQKLARYQQKMPKQHSTQKNVVISIYSRQISKCFPSSAVQTFWRRLSWLWAHSQGAYQHIQTAADLYWQNFL